MQYRIVSSPSAPKTPRSQIKVRPYRGDVSGRLCLEVIQPPHTSGIGLFPYEYDKWVADHFPDGAPRVLFDDEEFEAPPEDTIEVTTSLDSRGHTCVTFWKNGVQVDQIVFTTHGEVVRGIYCLYDHRQNQVKLNQ